MGPTCTNESWLKHNLLKFDCEQWHRHLINFPLHQLALTNSVRWEASTLPKTLSILFMSKTQNLYWSALAYTPRRPMQINQGFGTALEIFNSKRSCASPTKSLIMSKVLLTGFSKEKATHFERWRKDNLRNSILPILYPSSQPKMWKEKWRAGELKLLLSNKMFNILFLPINLLSFHCHSLLLESRRRILPVNRGESSEFFGVIQVRAVFTIRMQHIQCNRMVCRNVT